MANETLKTASVLAFERKLDPSDALFYGGDWAQRNNSSAWAALGIGTKSVRGTISNRLKSKDQDPAKLDAAIESPNLQTVDVATLPHDADTLKVQFSLRVLAGTGSPSACNDATYRERLEQTIQAYVAEHRFDELAHRYASNLANARWLWRNRIGAEQVEVLIEHLVDGQPAASWTFDALDLSLRHFEAPASAAARDDLGALSMLFAAGLRGECHVLLSISAYVRIGRGQEVFPSQELILDRGRGDKSKTLYHVNGVAGIHSQKLGNAIRSVDTWYPGADELGPIAVEPYGSVTTQGKAYRQPKEKADFYTLLDNWILKGKAPERTGDQHYVLAVLIRGGVFGEAG
ncbi:type I-F CRISPR-associated protein Csy3 [Pseudomonas sp. NY15437]|uniref:type I-F CRISPR-associated protein Csy3 n=1 Tax=Pseudomonas sp. NY15437 TaxID=3400360 RepID=UPI003A8C0D9F